ncbi:MAG: ATP-binding protein [Defluviitaleaceae bacterium]|nr:ATP-binding protein [Defluviitaleaceae bacterium]
MIQRPKYLAWLIQNKGTSLIKVISGVRRSGKSTLFELYKVYLFELGIQPDQIIHLNFEQLKYYHLRHFLTLHDYILKKTQGNQHYYLFFDEIQRVDQFEEVVNSLNLEPNLDLYITGSNAYFMSGELATLLAGRYIELNVLPLSFSEFAGIYSDRSLPDIYDQYKLTAFPYLADKSEEERFDYMNSTYNDIAIKDIIRRYGITETDLLERVLRFIVGAIGSEISINNIVNKLKSDGSVTSNKTIEKYVDAFLSGLIIYKAPRYDIRGKKLLQRLEKYYVVDLGFRYLLLPDAVADDGHLLENMIYLELRRRYRHVYVGKNDRLEVDFVCFDDRAHPTYYQVALHTMDETVLKRELRSLQTINDQHPKYLITLDWINKEANYDGIKKINALNWLLNDEET